LLLKISGYTNDERETSWQSLEAEIPQEKIVSNDAPSFLHAMLLEKEGMYYFDSLITCLALQKRAVVSTTDRRIGEIIEMEW
jgi:hypothetical protein